MTPWPPSRRRTAPARRAPWPTSSSSSAMRQRRHHHHAGHEVGGQVGEDAVVGDAVEVLDRERPGRRAGDEADHEQARSIQSRPRWSRPSGQGRPTARGARGQTSASATSAAVAQNDISKPGCTTTSGSISRMISAASASECRLIARRSSRMARKATEAVIAARRAGGVRAGEHQVGADRDQPAGGGDLLAVHPQRQPGPGGDQEAQREEHEAAERRRVQAGDRQHVGQARGAQVVARLGGSASPGGWW